MHTTSEFKALYRELAREKAEHQKTQGKLQKTQEDLAAEKAGCESDRAASAAQIAALMAENRQLEQRIK